MAFYDLPKNERTERIGLIMKDIWSGIEKNKLSPILEYFSDEDTYIRKTAYQAVGKIYFANRNLQTKIVSILGKLIKEKEPKVRQTVVNSAGEI